MAETGRIVAIVGAESTGKSTLARALAEALPALTGWRCTWVPEVLREWCEAAGRTPREDEQAGIAAEQARRLEAAARQHELVLADTTPLMTAVYHHQVFGSSALDILALDWQRRHCEITLLTALDLPWQADGLQRDGPHVRQPVDARLRHLLVGQRLPFTVVAGRGARRTDAALDALGALWRPQTASHGMRAQGLFSRLDERESRQPAWLWTCSDCDQPDCEHLAFQRS